MKMTKKVLAMALCLVMVLSMATTVFAANDHKHNIEIHNSVAGYEYVAYQVFSGELDSNGTLANIEWGPGVDGAAIIAALNAKLPEGAKAYEDARDVAAMLANSGSKDNATAVAFAELVANNLKENAAVAGTSTYNGSTAYNIPVVGDGYYLVYNTAVPEGGTNTSYTRYILKVVANVEVNHKGDFPKVDKVILEDGKKVNINSKSIGDVVTYEFSGTMPSNIDYYSTYYYMFKDTLSKGLTYNNDAKVTVNGVDVTEYFYINASAWSETAGTTIKVGMQDLLRLENITEDLDAETEGVQTVGKITKDTTVVVTYTATLNQYAEIAANGDNPNVVDLTYDNNPNDDGDGVPTPPPPNPDEPTPPDPVGKTPEKKVTTYTTELYVRKYDGQMKVLEGAQFTLEGEGVKTVIITREVYTKAAEGQTGKYYKLNDGTYTDAAPVYDDPNTEDVNEDTSHGYAVLEPIYVLDTQVEVVETSETTKAQAYVDTNGYVRFTGLGAGDYVLTETVTPSGYDTVKPQKFTITFTPNTTTLDGEFDFEIKEGDEVEYVTMFNSDRVDNAFYIQVVNVAGSILPETGGIGTTLFYVFGSLLFIGAGVLLVTKKRMAA